MNASLTSLVFSPRSNWFSKLIFSLDESELLRHLSGGMSHDSLASDSMDYDRLSHALLGLTLSRIRSADRVGNT